jgi:tRNA pseudouridine65 synthase
MAKPLEILYHDQLLAAINKPSGLLVHRTQLDRRETRFAVQLLRNQLGRQVYPLHRLDKPTSGLLLFALNRETAKELGRDFAAHQVEKSYLAVVRGWPDAEGVIDYPLVDGPEWGSKTVQNDSDLARPARTGYRVLAQSELPFAVGRYSLSRYALVEAWPETGRRHQIRRHFKHIFHPLIGDTRYGEGRHNRLFREQFACHRLLLHARSLQFKHPENGQSLRIEAPLPEEFRQVLQQSGLWPNMMSCC